MRKYKFEAKFDGYLTLEDESLPEHQVETHLRDALYCTIEDGNSPNYLSMGLSEKSIKIKKIDDDYERG